MTESAISVNNVVAKFPLRGWPFSREYFTAVNDVSFELLRGETLGLVGESGSGKSTLGRMLVGLLKPASGRIRVGDIEVAQSGASDLRKLRHKVQMVFQDPYSSLNPRMRVEELISEPLRNLKRETGVIAHRRVRRVLDLCGLPGNILDKYPHEFSGGQRQRIGIARALVVEPEILVADEPVASLDVSIQAQIVNLLKDLRSEIGLTCLFISHDLAVVQHIANRVAVMFRGRIVEMGTCDRVLRNAMHPYTRRLIASIPIPDPSLEAIRQSQINTSVETDLPRAGCSYQRRCSADQLPICARTSPELTGEEDQRAACHVAMSFLREGTRDAGIRSTS